MNLIKNVDGDWAASKGRVRQDLDTLQRTVNALQAQLASLTTQVNTPAKVAAPVISAKNTVAVANGNFLSVVTKGAGLTGNGTPTSALAVNVDGVTITVNAANQLVGGAGGGLTILNTTFSLSNAQMQTLSSAPVTLLAGQGAGTRIIPVAVITHAQVTVLFAASVNQSLEYAVQSLSIAGPINLFQSAVGDYYSNMFPIQAGISNTLVPVNSAVRLRGSADSVTSGSTSSVTGIFYYFLAPV